MNFHWLFIFTLDYLSPHTEKCVFWSRSLVKCNREENLFLSSSPSPDGVAFAFEMLIVSPQQLVSYQYYSHKFSFSHMCHLAQQQAEKLGSNRKFLKSQLGYLFHVARISFRRVNRRTHTIFSLLLAFIRVVELSVGVTQHTGGTYQPELHV